MPTVLIADDEKNIRSTLARALRLEGYGTLEAEDGAGALKILEGSDADLAILDLQMPKLDGLGVMEAMRDRGTRIPVIVLTAHGTIEKAIRATRLGAFDFIEKPPSTDRILLAVANALRYDHLESENRRLATEAGVGGEILGESAPIAELLATIGRVGPTDAGVLLQGENGTGKELVARAIHTASKRSKRPLVTVNCAAVPETLFESELFGHTRGAFTGATEARRGKFQLADGGSLFLDEIGEVPLPLQPKMLRALESGEVERIGGRAVEKVNVRVIAATNRNLEEEVAEGRFREDLYYRLLVVPIRVPPLRERIEDVPLLARHFLDGACRRNRTRARRLDDDAIAFLRRHTWPGNVRELRNAMERVAILSSDAVVHAAHLSFLHQEGRSASPDAGRAAPSGAFDLSTEVQKAERALVLQVLERNDWHMTQAARELNLERSHLYKKLKVLGIERPGRTHRS